VSQTWNRKVPARFYAMSPMLADYDPGTLTGFYIICLAGMVVVFCLVGAGVSALMKSSKAARRWMIAAGVCIALAVLVVVAEICLAKRIGLP